MGRVIALLGAESTGKTSLSLALAKALSQQGRQVTVVPEGLRQWCDLHGRTPRVDEQQAIAEAQTEAIERAAAVSEVVIADTTSLMTAVYSHLLFGDMGLYAPAIQAQRSVALTLLTGLDLPWVADGLQRDGAHVRGPVDAAVREVLLREGLPHAVIYGQGEHRVKQALAAVDACLLRVNVPRNTAPGPRWRWICERCDDGDCEQHWLPRS
ncbi:MAG: AAA family ATPase [Aquabacterium sp.]|jgi:nicotinamide riboside kinase